MSDASNHTPFTAADIERYYSGNMTAAERHALEKAALDDPFLADALEGYAATATPADDVVNIQIRLKEKLQKRKAAPVFSVHNSWLQIAALVLLLAGAGWLVYHLNSTDKNEIAIAAPAAQKQPGKLEKAPPADSAITGRTTTPEMKKVQPTKKSNTIAHKNKPSKQSKEEHSLAQKQQKKGLALQANNVQQNETAAISSYIPPARNNPEALLKRSIAGQSKNAAANKSNNGAADSATDLFAAQGMSRTGTSGDTIHLNVMMQPSHESLNEVVEVHLNAKKRAAAKPSVHFEELEPAEGWTNFNNYIAENLKEPEEIKEKPLSGDVELSFEVNTEGEAVNIKVEKSLCSKCDEEAIRLLKEGPKWKKEKTKKGKVIIHFPRP